MAARVGNQRPVGRVGSTATVTGGGGGITMSQLTSALGSKANKAAMDALEGATSTQIAAIQQTLDAMPDVTLSTATPPARQADGSILVTYSDGSTTLVDAPAKGEVNAVTQAEYDSLADKTGVYLITGGGA